MGRGKVWSNTETMALCEAFIHISEDAITSNNQSGDTLYARIAAEAKSRYSGDWMRSPDACKKRWKDVSKEVQLFCAAVKFVESVEHSGWNEDDYFKAAKEYYIRNHKDPNVTDFKYEEEWKFLKDFEKWKTTQYNPMAAPKTIPSSAEAASPNDSDASDFKINSRPTGNKKQQTLETLVSKAEQLFEKFDEKKNIAGDDMMKMMEANIEQSKKIVRCSNKFLRVKQRNLQKVCWHAPNKVQRPLHSRHLSSWT